MSLYKGRERALTNLLGVNAFHEEHRPTKLTLPTEVSSKIIEAVALTDEDDRERKTGFRYRFGHWRSGPLRTGSAIELREDGSLINASTGTSLVIGRPHLHMHTHPTPELQRTIESVERRPYTSGWSPSRKRKQAEAEYRTHRGFHMLPSGGDIDNMYSISSGSIGNMIASTGGIFVALRNDVRNKELLTHEDPTGVKDIVDDYRDHWQTAYDAGMSVYSTRHLLLAAGVKALEHRYTCYFTDNPESPALYRVG